MCFNIPALFLYLLGTNVRNMILFWNAVRYLIYSCIGFFVQKIPADHQNQQDLLMFFPYPPAQLVDWLS